MQPKHHKHVTGRITKVKCNAATCLIRPQHVGPKPDRIRQVSLYHYAWAFYTTRMTYYVGGVTHTCTKIYGNIRVDFYMISKFHSGFQDFVHFIVISDFNVISGNGVRDFTRVGPLTMATYTSVSHSAIHVLIAAVLVHEFK